MKSCFKIYNKQIFRSLVGLNREYCYTYTTIYFMYHRDELNI